MNPFRIQLLLTFVLLAALSYLYTQDQLLFSIPFFFILSIYPNKHPLTESWIQVFIFSFLLIHEFAPWWLCYLILFKLFFEIFIFFKRRKNKIPNQKVRFLYSATLLYAPILFQITPPPASGTIAVLLGLSFSILLFIYETIGLINLSLILLKKEHVMQDRVPHVRDP